ncbi:cytochrome P450 [Xylariaceae sp. FL1019]|nr:cytochrome P450 [Xylariaceae sp. FL1019]
MAPLAFLSELGRREQALFGIGVIVIAIWVIQQLFFTIRYPSNLPRVGSRWKYHTDTLGLYREVWENYLKKGKTVVVPGLLFHDDVLLPPSALRWLIRQPERLVSASAAQVEVLQPNYGFGHDKFIQDPWPGMLVKTDLNAVLENVCAAMNAELGVAIDSHFGTDTSEWKEFRVLPTIQLIVAQAATRFTLGASPVGSELCLNKEYLRACLDVNDALVINAGLGSTSPRLLRPILGRIGAISAKRQIKALEKFIEPVYRERLRILEEEAANPGIETPEDHFQLMMSFAMKERRDEAMSLTAMTKRICVANVGSMHQTSIQVANMLLNIIDSDAEFNTTAILRDEIAQIVGDNRATGWDKGRVAALTRADSVARETLRLHSFGIRGVTRMVVADGVVTEDGIELPRGAMVSVNAYWAQLDGTQIEDPFKFDPFRFSRQREAEVDEQGKPGIPSLSFISTGPQNLAFSHGKHACPGRYLVDFELKMIIAYVLSNYDLEFPKEYNGKRPANLRMMEVNIPRDDVIIRVKRRVTNS